MRSGTERLQGTRSPGSTVEFTDCIVFVTYPTPTSWQADIVLEPGVTEYVYRILRRDGTYSPYVTHSVTFSEQEPQQHPAANTLDAWGTRLDTPRNTNESNKAYHTRLLDIFVHRGSANYVGLLNAIARDLALDYYDQALVIQTKASTLSGERLDNVSILFTSTKVLVSSPDLIVNNQKIFIDPSDRSISPIYKVTGDVALTLEDGTPLKYDYDEQKNKLYVYGPYGGEMARITYVYSHSVSRLDKTLSELETELEALQLPGGQQILDVTVYSGLGSYDAEKLSRIPETLIEEDHLDASGTSVSGLPVRWTDMKIEVVWDPEIQENERTWTGSLYNTRFDSAHEALIATGRQTWGSAVSDDSVWGSRAFPLHGGQYFDTIYDAPLGYWENPVTGDKFDQWEAVDGTDPSTGETLIYKGIRRTDFQSGVGGENDLKVSVESSETIVDTLSEGTPLLSEASSDDIPDDDPVSGYVDLD